MAVGHPGDVALFFGGYATLVVLGARSMGGIFTAGPTTEVGIGQEVRDGKFVFIVTEVSTSANPQAHKNRLAAG